MVAQQVRDGMVLENTRVAGLYPFRGARLTVTIVLCKIQRSNYGSKILGLVESAAAALDFSSAVGPYVKIGRVVLEGVEALSGDERTTALVGERIEYDVDAKDVIRPTHRALVNATCDESKFWVKNNELYFGDSLREARPYTDADYVLYEIARTDLRSDIDELPFYPLFQRVKEESARGGKDSWKQAKANMLALYQAMVLSPDVTKAQRELLLAEFTKEMQEIRKNSMGIQYLAARDEEERKELDDAVRILDL